MKYLTDAVNSKSYNVQVSDSGMVFIYHDHKSVAIKDADMAEIVHDWENAHVSTIANEK
jgi:hypothetical protein